MPSRAPAAASVQTPRIRAVLHLVWDGRRLLAWAESGASDPFRLLQARDGLAPHPCALAPGEVAAALNLPRTGRLVEVRLRLPLPARPGAGISADPSRLRPVPPPGMGPPADVPFPLALFAVPAAELPAEAMAALLRAPRPLPPDWRLGGDARFWRQAGRLALAVCARGALVPAVAPVGAGTVGAVWSPAPSSELIDAAAALAAAMPPACRLAAPGEDPAALVQGFVARAADACARAALAERRTAWTRHLRPEVPAMRRVLGLLHARPLPLVGPAAAVAEGAAAAAVAHGTAARVRLVLRLDEPEAAPPEAAGEPGPPPAGPGERAEGSVPALAAAACCPLTLWLQTYDAAGAPAALLPLSQARRADRRPDARWEDRRLAAAALEALRSAARRWEPLARVLRAPQEDGLDLSPEEAVEFVERAAPGLEADGVEVVVPSWWRRPPARPTARLSMRDAPGGLDRGALAEFRWEVALGGESLSARQFEALVASRRPLVRLRSGWVRVDPALLGRLADGWVESGGEGRVPAITALRLAVEARAAEAPRQAPDAEAPVVDASGRVAAWLAALEDSRRAAPLSEPPGFVGRLRPYQRAGLGWLAFLAGLGMGGCLADDMGLGKTVQVLALLAHRRAAGEQAGPSLLVCPTSVLANWCSEAARFVPDLRLHVHYGPERARGASLRAAAAGADLALTTYALLARDGEDLAGVSWDGVVLDEAQNIKNPLAKQAQAARALPARFRLALTGTPVENGLRDLWSIFAFILPGYLGGSRVFSREYAGPVGGGDERAASRLRRVLAPFVLRRTKRDPDVAPELPPKLETRQECALGPEQAALYEAVTRQALEEIEAAVGLRRRAAILTTLLRLKQICDHPSLFLGDGGRLDGRSGKLRRLEELLGDVLAEGDRALVFTQFAAWARRLAPYLGERFGVPVLCLTGQVAGADRPAIVRAFQQAEGPGVFVLSLKAGGAGLNLTAAQHVFHYDRWWNPAVEAQATDRAYRIGQGRAVQVHRFVVRGTLEERIDALVAGKAALAEAVVGGASEAWLTELGTDELRAILTMRREALDDAG